MALYPSRTSYLVVKLKYDGLTITQHRIYSRMSGFRLTADMLLKMLNEDEVSHEPVSKIEEVKEAPVERPKRCQNEACNTKLKLTDHMCKCKGHYCMQHRYSEAHKCTFDYKAAGRDSLGKQLTPVTGNKLERI